MNEILNDRELQEEFGRNRVKLKRCNKAEAIISISSIALSAGIILYSLLTFVGVAFDYGYHDVLIKHPISEVAALNTIDAFLAALPLSFLMFRASFKHHDICAAYSIAICILDIAALIVLRSKEYYVTMPSSFWVLLLYPILILILAAVNIKVNITYHWLEEQQGFPLFNIRYEQQKEDKFQRGIMDQYEANVRRWQKNSGEEMNDAGQSGMILDKYEHEHIQSSMDEL